jgi:hypothetical protein
MKRNYRWTAALLALMLWAGAAVVLAQDFQKTYALGAGGKILIRNISGDVKITGYEGDSILVTAIKTGRDKEKVIIEDASAGDRVDLKVKYPEQCNCDASVQFDVRVPSRVDYDYEKIASVSGDVTVAKIRGNLHANSVSGNVTVAEATGIVNASSVSGDVGAQITKINGSGKMKFSSVSGNVDVRAPVDIDANVEMSTVSGALKTDFPLEIKEKNSGSGRSAQGLLGSGSSGLKISSVSGKISFVRN